MTEAEDRWIAQLGTVGGQSKTTLVCFPYAGGTHDIFRPWAQLLPAEIELLAVRLPGRSTRISERAHTEWPSLIEDVTTAITPYLDGRYAFFGHSFGARLAYEVLHALAVRGVHSADRLFVSGSRSPRTPQRLPFMHTLDEDEFREALRLLGGTPPELLANKVLMDVLSPTVRRDIALAEQWGDRHAGIALETPITAFYGRDDSIDNLRATQGWREHTTDELETVEISGGHFFLNTHRTDVLAMITKRLETASAHCIDVP